MGVVRQRLLGLAPRQRFLLLLLVGVLVVVDGDALLVLGLVGRVFEGIAAVFGNGVVVGDIVR